ncbi:MAG TPA: tetratricopeptide repeat protein [Vicinamibacterales bacterium]|nr:tetratricopeptide repeat protein [Vicinamibacterales bacterium]HPW19194.1 tetratricopeptide repeat protein [Vicinamibacterales bacterium]
MLTRSAIRRCPSLRAVAAICAFIVTAAPAPAQGPAAAIKAGRALEEAGKLDQAITEYGKAIAASPASAEGWLRRGVARNAAGQPGPALQDLDRAIQFDPSSAEAHMGRAVALNGLQRFSEAVSAATRALELRPGYGAAYQARGFAKFRLSDYRGAVEDESQAIEANRRDWGAYRIRGIAEVNLNLHREALRDLDKAIDAGIGGADMTHYFRGRARHALGDVKGALEDANRTIELNPSYPVGYLVRGDYRLAFGDRAGAEADYRKCVSLDPQGKLGLSSLAKLTAGAPGGAAAPAAASATAPPAAPAMPAARAAPAAAIHSALPPLDPSEVPPLSSYSNEVKLLAAFRASPTPETRAALARVRVEHALRLARAAEKQRDEKTFRTALGYAESAAELAPDNPAAWLLLGRLYAAIENNPVAADLAEQAFRAALEVRPGLADAQLGLGQICLRKGSLDRALNELEPAVAADPALATPEVVSTMGWAYIYDAQLDRGIRFFRGLLARQPGIEPVSIGLAVLLHENGSRAEAERTLTALATNAAAAADARGYAKALLEDWAKGGAR